MLHELKTFCIEEVDEEECKISYTGTLVAIPLIDYNLICKKTNECYKEKKELEDTVQELDDFVVGIANYTTKYWYEENKGAKKGCGRLADAMILANAVRGMTFAEIQAKSYPHKKGGTKRYGRDKIFEALSVKKPTDLERINSLLIDYPEVFEGIQREEIYCWMAKKVSKGVKK